MKKLIFILMVGSLFFGCMFIPNYLTEFGKEIITSREKEFISLMVIFGQIRLLQNISSKLNFADNSEIQKLKDKFFQ